MRRRHLWFLTIPIIVFCALIAMTQQQTEPARHSSFSHLLPCREPGGIQPCHVPPSWGMGAGGAQRIRRPD